MKIKRTLLSALLLSSAALASELPAAAPTAEEDRVIYMPTGVTGDLFSTDGTGYAQIMHGVPHASNFREILGSSFAGVVPAHPAPPPPPDCPEPATWVGLLIGCALVSFRWRARA